MKKIITRFVATVLAIALLAGINPAVSYATGKDNYQYKKLKTGKYFTPEESYEVYYKSPKHWEYTVYTLTFKENCVINITKTETTSYAHINPELFTAID